MRDVFSLDKPVVESHAAMCASFDWRVPKTFNFATDVIDRWAAERDGPALIWENAAGDERTYSYSELAKLSNRMANVLHARGVEKGDLRDPGNAQLWLGIAHYTEKDFAAAVPYFQRARQTDRYRNMADQYLGAIRAAQEQE